MKSLFQCTLLLFALVFSFTAQAQNAADEKAIFTRMQDIQSAFDAADADRFAAFFMENADFLSPVGHLLHGRTQIRDAHAGLFKSWANNKADKVAHELSNQHLRFLLPDLAMTTFTQKTTLTMGGKEQIDTASFIVLFRRTNGQWLVESAGLTPVQDMGEPKK